MPTYEYRCTKCAHVFDAVQRVGDPAPACPKCGSPTRKVFSSVGLIFKGTGFHTTDYRKPAPGPGPNAAPADAAPSGAQQKDGASGTQEKEASKTTKDASASKKDTATKGGASPASSTSDS